MTSDELELRTLHSTWMDAVNAGDLGRPLTLMVEDVVFLAPGQAPFGREVFSSNFVAAHQQMRIACTSDLEEVMLSAKSPTRGAGTHCRWPNAQAVRRRSSPGIA